MSVPRFVLVLSGIIVVMSAFLLLIGSEFLLYSLTDTQYVPFGTFLTWFGLACFPLLVYSSLSALRSPNNSWQRLFSVILKVQFVLSVLWLPMAYLLAGNWAFNFSNTLSFQGGQLAMKIFWIYSYGLPLSVLLLLILHIMTWLYVKYKGQFKA